MTAVNDVWRGLVRRRLWPVALVLVAALAAVPFVLAKSSPTVSAPSPLGSVNSRSARDGLNLKPIVAVTSDVGGQSRVVLGSRKDPFKPAVPASKSNPTQPTGGASKKPAGAAPKTAPKSAGGTAPSTSQGTVKTPSAIKRVVSHVGRPRVVRPVVPQVIGAPGRAYDVYSIAARFGLNGVKVPKADALRRLRALPTNAYPLAIYLGVMKGGRSAVFMIDRSVAVRGSGVCLPSATQCDTVQLKPGANAILTVVGSDGRKVEYKLELVKIHRSRTPSERAARKAHGLTSSGGREVLRKQMSRLGRYRFDLHAGTLKLLSAKSWKAAVARAAAARAAGH